MRSSLRAAAFPYLVAVTAVAAATAIRWLLAPALGDSLPFATFFLAVIFVAWQGGLWPAVAALILGWWSAEFFFVQPRYEWMPHGKGVTYWAETAVYCTVGILGTLICEAMRGARGRAAVREEGLRITLASIGDAVITTDTAGRITHLNAAAEALTGWGQEALGEPLDEVLRIIDEGTRQPAESPCARALREGPMPGLANPRILIMRDGAERPVEESVAAIRDEEGKAVGCVLVLRDISQRKQADGALSASETRKASMLRASLDAIITIDSGDRVIEFNPAAEALFGYSEAEALGREMADLIIPAQLKAKHQAGMAHYLSTGEAPVLNQRLEMPARRKDGSELTVELAITHLKGSDPPLFTGFVRDITRQKESDRRIQGLVAQLKDADRRKDEFLATLSHELRGPLAPLRNSLEIMKHADGEPRLLEPARATMERQVAQMVRLTDDLLDIARITGNQLELRRERVELAPVVYLAAEASKPMIASAGQHLEISLPSEPVWLHADAARLTQVIGNILNNASKYTAPGGRIGVTAEREQNGVTVKVRDNGAGIAPETLPRIFDMFVKGDPSPGRAEGGLGIGLALVRRLVEMHGGTVESFSGGLGLGSEFVVRLPIFAISQSLDAPPVPGGRAASIKYRILVADDNRDSADSLATLLELAGNEVQIAYDGNAAVEAAARFRPEVALLDLGMPKLSGYDACRQLREQPGGNSMVLIALTGWSQQQDRDRSKQAGFDAHMVKPVDLEVLETVLADLYQSRAPA